MISPVKRFAWGVTVKKTPVSTRSASTDEVDDLTQKITTEVSKGIRERFDKVRQLEPGQEDHVDIAREYVGAYVDYVDYVEKIHQDVMKGRDAESHG